MAVTLKSALLTVCVKLLETLGPKLSSPEYTAVIVVCDPAESVVVLKMATPEPFKSLVPKVVAPSLKVTVPVGVPPVPVTVAVNVTESPYIEGVPDVMIVVIDDGPEVTFNTPAVPLK